MNTKINILSVCTAALVCSVPLAAFAASPEPAASPKNSPKAKATSAEKTTSADTATKVRALPFHGKIATVEQTAKTFTIAGKEKSRAFKVTDATVITKSGAPGTFADLAANEEVRGNYVKAADGTMEARTVKVGPMTDAEKAEKKPSKKKKADDGSAPNPSPTP